MSPFLKLGYFLSFSLQNASVFGEGPTLTIHKIDGVLISMLFLSTIEILTTTITQQHFLGGKDATSESC